MHESNCSTLEDVVVRSLKEADCLGGCEKFLKMLLISRADVYKQRILLWDSRVLPAIHFLCSNMDD